MKTAPLAGHLMPETPSLNSSAAGAGCAPTNAVAGGVADIATQVSPGPAPRARGRVVAGKGHEHACRRTRQSLLNLLGPRLSGRRTGGGQGGFGLRQAETHRLLLDD